MTYPATRGLRRKGGRNRIVVGGVDVTEIDGKVTPFPSYSLTEPFGYGATSLSFPQYHAGYERPAWAKNGARVQLSRVFDDGSETIDYVGEVASIDPTGRELRMDVGGQFSGPASMLEEVPLMYRSLRDVGRWASLCANRVGLRFDPWFGPDTDIMLTHTGGQSLLSWASYLGAMSQDDDGTQRALMPTAPGSDVWHFPLKDYTNVHATAFHDDARVVLSVSDDATQRPNVIYGTCIGPDGTRYTNAKWPHVFPGPMPDYPIAGNADFGIGTTDADTINGDGITLLYINLRELNYLADNIANTGVYTDKIAAAVKRLQDDLHVAKTGTMTLRTWKGMFNADVVGYHIDGAYTAPLAFDPRVEEWLRASNGAIMGRNPDYDPSIPRVERYIDFGDGLTKAQMIRKAKGMIARSLAVKNWTGTLRFNNASLFAGDKSAAVRSSLTSADIMPMRDLRPGMNVIVPDFDGGTLFHVSGCDVDADGVTATIDTQARDLVEVREILARNAESRRDIRREWNAANRPARKSHGLITSDENFGILDRNVRLTGGQWNVVPMIAGQQGQINRVDIRLINTPAEFAWMLLSKPMTRDGKGGVSPRLKRKFPNPLSTADETWLEKDDTIDWLDDKTILAADGTGKQPAGYGSRRKFDDAGKRTTAPITGRLLDDESFPYECAAHTAVIVYLAIYPDRDCTLKRGKILYCQLNDAA